MTRYNYSALSHFDFEQLTADIVEHRLKIKLERFAQGQDAGIDARYARGLGQPEVIVQAKHFHKSGYNSLYSHMRRKELSKIQKLNPKRYILVTSVELSPSKKERLSALLTGYIVSTGDIIGLSEIDSEIAGNETIEKKNFKLWLATASILNRILQQDIFKKSESVYETEILENLQVFVTTNHFFAAQSILKENRFIVITGMPGVGKSLLSNMLAYKFVAQIPDAEFCWIEDINEGWRRFDESRPQVFLVDDFLGSNYLNILEGNTDSRIARFIKRIVSTKGKFLILSSRTVILNHVQDLSEVFRRDRTFAKAYELEIEKYSRFDKAHILYNHLHFYGVPASHIREVIKDNFYMKIIDHRNYNPRIIEFITRPELLPGEPSSFPQYCLRLLNKPEEIWTGTYRNQLNRESQLILQELFFFGDKAEEEQLRLAYERRCEVEGVPRKAPFLEHIRVLQKSFVVRFYDKKEVVTYYRYFNPSLVDFMLMYLRDNVDEQERAIRSARQIGKLIGRFSLIDPDKLMVPNSLQRLFKDSLMELALLDSKAGISTVRFLTSETRPKDTGEMFYEIMRAWFSSATDREEMMGMGSENFVIAIQWGKGVDGFFDLLRSNKEITFHEMFDTFDFYLNAKAIPKILESIFEVKFERLMKEDSIREIVQVCSEMFWDDFANRKIFEEGMELGGDRITGSELESIYYGIIEHWRESNEELHLSEPDEWDIDLENLADEINEARFESFDWGDESEEYHGSRGGGAGEELREIHDMFSILKE